MCFFQKIAIPLVCICYISCFGCSSAKIGVVDSIRLFQESNPGKLGMNHLKEVEESMQQQIELAQKLVEKSPKNEKLRIGFQKLFMNYQKTINSEQQKVVDFVNELIQKTLDEYRVAKGYKILINKDSILSYDPSDDVTSEIVTLLMGTSMTFDPVKFEALKPDGTLMPISSGSDE